MNLDTSFCMESGQIKTGEDKQDTYVKMLQEVVRVTAPVAYGIAADYPNVMSLVKVMKRHGPTCLEDIEVCFLIYFNRCSALFCSFSVFLREKKLRSLRDMYRNAPTRTEFVQIGKLGPRSVNDCIGCLWSWILHVRTFEPVVFIVYGFLQKK